MANCGFEFLGSGSSFVREEMSDVCCPGDKFVFREGDYQSSKVKFQPRMTFNSTGPASALSLSLTSMLSWGVGSSE
jgi:hypothetical protein